MEVRYTSLVEAIFGGWSGESEKSSFLLVTTKRLALPIHERLLACVDTRYEYLGIETINLK